MKMFLSCIALAAVLVLLTACRSVLPASQEDMDRLRSQLSHEIQKANKESGTYTRTLTVDGNAMRSIDEDGTERISGSGFKQELKVTGDLRAMGYDPMLRPPVADSLQVSIRHLQSQTPAQPQPAPAAPPPPVYYNSGGGTPFGGDWFGR